MQRDTTWIHLDLDATDKYIFSYIYILHDMILESPDNFIILILYIYVHVKAGGCYESGC